MSSAFDRKDRVALSMRACFASSREANCIKQTHPLMLPPTMTHNLRASVSKAFSSALASAAICASNALKAAEETRNTQLPQHDLKALNQTYVLAHAH